jgi:HEAT repeat protein
VQTFPPYLALSILLLVGCVSCQAESSHNDPLTLTATLLELLKDPSPDIRRTAALSLGKIGHSAGTEGLIQTLSDSDPLVREYSAWSLGQIGEEVNTDAALALVSALGDPHPAVKHSAAKALGQIGVREPIVPLLLEGLAVGAIESRRAVVDALMHLEEKSSYPALITALKDPDPKVRQGTIAALGELGDRQALPSLRKILLVDENVGVRTEAAYRLGKLGGQEDRPSLEKSAKQDTAPIVHLWTSWAINNLSPAPDANDSKNKPES